MIKKLVCALALLTATAAFAATNNPAPVPTTPSKWAVTLGGVGLTAGDNIFADWQWGGEVSVARKVDFTLLKDIRSDIGLRQSMNYGTIGYSSSSQSTEFLGPCDSNPFTQTTTTTTKVSGWMFRSELFWDFNVPVYKSLVFFIGPNVSINYGGDVDTIFTIGPEAGVKLGLGKLAGKDTYWYVRSHYDCNLENGNYGFRVASGFGVEF